MATATQPTTGNKAMLWAGYILSALPVLLLVMSGVMKLSGSEQAIKGFEQFGYKSSVAAPLGIVELISTALYVIPQTAVLGAILLTGYLGGATATHLRVGEAFIAPVLVGVVIWLGLFLRDRRIREIVPWRKPSA